MRETSAPRLDLRQLQYFVFIAEKGSIAAGAAALGMAPATVSEGLANLEARLGTPLVLRSVRGVTLTAAGDALLQHAHDLLQAAEALADAVGRTSQPHGALSLALPPSLNVLISVPLAETVQTELPEVRLRLPEGMSGSILDWVSSESVDMGFAYEVSGVDGFEARQIFREELFLFCAPDFLPDGVRETEAGYVIEPRQLVDLPLVTSSKRHKTRQFLESWARRIGVTLKISSEIESHSQILEMVKRASAYTIVPKAAALTPLLTGDLVAVRFEEPVQRSCHIVRKRGRVVTAASLAVEEQAIKILKEMNARFDLKLIF
ncbi:LysR family transcriptional regulator [Celeribacter naphthalenivorans]|uniref:LysR family transcriptional regulator n=1 Tax=Celeribacter naphthalenivorans TaxID=1614694 RepID=UPI001CF9AC17|nr:LysR family transcriptional regulator [Celeribacter naphthalenivorans]